MSVPRYSWIVLGYLFVMQAVIIGIGVYSFTFFVVPWMQAFSTDRSTLMIAVSGSSIGTAILSPLCGYLMDRFSNKRLLLFGATSYALCLLVISRVPDAWWLIMLYILVLPFGMVLAGSLMASSMVARNFVDHRGLALGISALGVSVGGFIMPVLVTQLLNQHDWHTVFVYLAGIVLTLVIIPGLFIVRDGERTADFSGSASSQGVGVGLMMSPEVLKLGMAFFSPVLIFVAVLHNLGSLAVDYSIAQEHAAWMVSIASVVMAVSKLASGMLSDRFSHAVIYTGMLVSQIAGLIILGLFNTFSPVLIGVTLIAVGAGGSLPVITSYAAKHWDSNSIGRVMGIVFALAGLSGIGPIIAGVIRDLSGSYTLSFIALLLVMVPAAWSFLSLDKRPGASPIHG